MSLSNRALAPLGLIASLVFISDQLSKALLLYVLPLHDKIVLCPYLNFTLAYNHGAAFGFLATAGGWQRWFFVGLAAILVITGIIWTKRLQPNEKLSGIAFALIIGGALGNLADRIRVGYVVDFIDFYIGSWHWYTFNIADIAICVGAALLAWTTLKN